MSPTELQDAPTPTADTTGPRLRLARILREEHRRLHGGLPARDGDPDPVDTARILEEEALQLALLDLHRGVQTQVTEALDRIAQSVYGRCVGCGRSIPPARMRALPFALRCVPCQERYEAEMRRRGRHEEEFVLMEPSVD